MNQVRLYASIPEGVVEIDALDLVASADYFKAGVNRGSALDSLENIWCVDLLGYPRHFGGTDGVLKGIQEALGEFAFPTEGTRVSLVDSVELQGSIFEVRAGNGLEDGIVSKEDAREECTSRVHLFIDKRDR
jgi:hypothetical protein